ncbi:MAG: response regulator transcription factor [Herpetosiphon sp.]
MTPRRVLLIDDDADLRDMVGLVLQGEQYEVITAATGAEGLQALIGSPPHLVILDVNLPDMDGFDVLREIRKTSKVCVLMLTGRADARDVVTGLDTGADDYLVKPFRSDELTARARALLRRVPPADHVMTVGAGEVTIDTKARIVLVRGQAADLTPTEYQLLMLLSQSAGEVLDHEILLRKVWGDDSVSDTAYLKVYIWHLRRKLELDPHHPQIIRTEWGVGYRMMP